MESGGRGCSRSCQRETSAAVFLSSEDGIVGTEESWEATGAPTPAQAFVTAARPVLTSNYLEGGQDAGRLWLERPRRARMLATRRPFRRRRTSNFWTITEVTWLLRCEDARVSRRRRLCPRQTRSSRRREAAPCRRTAFCYTSIRRLSRHSPAPPATATQPRLPHLRARHHRHSASPPLPSPAPS